MEDRYFNEELINSFSEPIDNHSESTECEQIWEILEKARHLIAGDSEGAMASRDLTMYSEVPVWYSQVPVCPQATYIPFDPRTVPEPETLQGMDKFLVYTAKQNNGGSAVKQLRFKIVEVDNKKSLWQANPQRNEFDNQKKYLRVRDDKYLYFNIVGFKRKPGSMEVGQSKPFGQGDAALVPNVYYLYQLAERDGEKYKIVEDRLKLYVLRTKDKVWARKRPRSSVAAAGGGIPTLSPAQNSMQLVTLPQRPNEEDSIAQMSEQIVALAMRRLPSHANSAMSEQASAQFQGLAAKEFIKRLRDEA